MTARGLLIVLEGVEGVGKTTQWERLRDRLQETGHSVVALREPGGTAAGDVIRRVLLDPAMTLSNAAEALLFAASRAELISQLVQPALEAGHTVLLDRFLLSTYAYQGAGRGLSIEVLRTMNAAATRGVTPDVTLLLTMPLDAALRRASARSAADRIELEQHAFHERVARCFVEATTEQWQAAHPECGRITRVDATGTAAEVTNRCVAFLAQHWPSQLGVLVHDIADPPAVGTSA